MYLSGNVIRISFADSGKRRDIIGDEPGFELVRNYIINLCKLI